ncbi:MAG: gliding motility-associated C-terminal domain-containing protein [Cyclobacteriaceae bacterium]|nr:gliding motility-associated C-terminal domain-containing protein [Cyclobacteriaceae bacterium]
MKTPLTVVLLLALLGADGQSLFNQNSIVSVGANQLLYISDSVVNNGTIINNGEIQVGGIWQNNDTYQPGQGQLTLTSSQTQVINHNNQSFTRLTISGGGAKIFEADITIENELVMDNGILQSSGNAKIIINEGAIISGGSANSYIDGPLYHVGTGDKYYPIGINNVFLPVDLLGIQGSMPTIGVLLRTPNPNLAVVGNLVGVTDQQYWELDVLSGIYDNSFVRLPINEELFLESVQQAVVAQSSDLDTPFTSVGGTNISGDVVNGRVTSEVASIQNFLTIGQNAEEATTGINVYNAISPNEDGINDFLKIGNIELYPNNNVTVYTRWGNKVFEMFNYDNVDNVFVGQTNVGKQKQLLDGTYYYVIEKGDGSKNESGFIVIRN